MAIKMARDGSAFVVGEHPQHEHNGPGIQAQNNREGQHQPYNHCGIQVPILQRGDTSQ